jgi:hypothetical protein
MNLQTVFWFVILVVVLYFFAKSLKQALTVLGGHALYEVFNFSFDWIIWPLVQAKGGWVGLLLLFVMAYTINLIVLWFYQRMKKDWLGVTVLEEMKVRATEMAWKNTERGGWYQPIHVLITGVFKALMWLMRSDAVTFVAFSCHHDSFVATAFLRKGRFGPLTGRDLVVFTASTVFSCAFWALVSGWFIIPSVTNVWQTLMK